jgi:pimeloyl-ACP methyl ester carboxylesterase
VPVLLTHGSGDITATESACARIRDALPDATDSVYADTGHLTFIEREQRFDSELETFAARVNAR